MAKDTLVIMCSGTGFTPKVLDFLRDKLGLTETDYDLFAVPGEIYSLGISCFLPKFKWVTERWVKFLVDEHGLSKVVVIHHEGCSWFKRLTVSDPEFIGKTQDDFMTSVNLMPLLPVHAELSVWCSKKTGDTVDFVLRDKFVR